ncbi:hypothetical protein ACQ86G_04275 [Roseateles chitinivorans]|uniref:hypothetical protein n=1 Tax=Roseateles chitinivorans TaxID=2917965 RepID=UPI003D668806
MPLPQRLGLERGVLRRGRECLHRRRAHDLPGPGDRWERLRTRGTIALPIQDLVWYEDRLWAATHVGLFVLDGDTLRKADEVPNQIYGHHLAVRDGVMLMGSPYGAAFRRDGEWTQIFSQYDTRTWYAENKDQAWKPVFKPAS